MKAGRELDALVAEKVMGISVPFTDWACGVTPSDGHYEAAMDRANTDAYSWYTDKGPINISESGFAEPIAFYSTDIAAAWSVLEKVMELGWTVTLAPRQFEKYPEDRFNFHGCRFKDGGPRLQGFAKHAETAQLAICLGALQAMERA